MKVVLTGASGFVGGALCTSLVVQGFDGVGAWGSMPDASVRGCREVVRHRVNKLLVSAKDPAEPAEAIGFLLDHPVQRAPMGAAAREIVAREYSVLKVAGEMRGFYQELLGQSWEARSSLPNA